MTLGILYIIFFMILLIASVILAILTTKELNKNESIELIGKN